MTTTKHIIVTWRAEGWHRWPAAPDETGYLRHSHRHMFHWRVEAEINSLDRELEFHALLHHARSISYKFMEGNSTSCESAADMLLKDLYSGGFPTVTAVECWEDRECGSRVEWAK